jgi:hypothetical protein
MCLQNVSDRPQFLNVKCRRDGFGCRVNWLFTCRKAKAATKGTSTMVDCPGGQGDPWGKKILRLYAQTTEAIRDEGRNKCRLPT